MFRKNESLLKNKKGMTLIEILIVVGIIASVLGFVMNRVIRRGKKAKISQAKIILNTLSQSIEEFNMDCGSYPGTLKELLKAPNDCGEWDGPYVKSNKFLKDPWKNDIRYEYDPNLNDFELLSFGADGRPGGGDATSKDISSKDL